MFSSFKPTPLAKPQMTACFFLGEKDDASIPLFIAFPYDCRFLYGLSSLVVEISLAVGEFRLFSNKTFTSFSFTAFFFYTLPNLLHSFYFTVSFLILIFAYSPSYRTHFFSSSFISSIFLFLWFRFLFAADIACFLSWFSKIVKFQTILNTYANIFHYIMYISRYFYLR